MKLKNKRNKTNYSNQKGITLIALVITIVVLLILAGVSINAIFSENGIINKAKDAQNKMDQATQNDLDSIDGLSNWIDSKTNGNTGGDDNTTVKISTLVGKSAVTKNTKAEDVYGNKITIPKGFKVLAHGTTDGSAIYTYSGDNIPVVQDGIVIENETDGNQFVWVPVGKINNKSDDSRGTTTTITFGRCGFEYNESQTSALPNTAFEGAENYIAETSIKGTFGKYDDESYDYKELATFKEGNDASDFTAENATARNLGEFIKTTQANGGYYIARFEASGTESKIYSKYNQTVLVDITQPNAAKLAREMYGEVKENNELVYASDLVNSYAWDTAIEFIELYHHRGQGTTSTVFGNTGMSGDKGSNICDMYLNAYEWTTEHSTFSEGDASDGWCAPCVSRGGRLESSQGISEINTNNRISNATIRSYSDYGFRAILYVN